MPPKKGSNTGLIITLSVLGVLLLLCCGGSIFVFAKAKDTVDSSIDAANSAFPTVTATDASPEESPSPSPEDSSLNDTKYARVGQCVKTDPLPDNPDHMVIAPCSDAGTYTIKKRFDGTRDLSKCDGITSSSFTQYYETDSSRDFVLCIEEN